MMPNSVALRGELSLNNFNFNWCERNESERSWNNGRKAAFMRDSGHKSWAFHSVRVPECCAIMMWRCDLVPTSSCVVWPYASFLCIHRGDGANCMFSRCRVSAFFFCLGWFNVYNNVESNLFFITRRRKGWKAKGMIKSIKNPFWMGKETAKNVSRGRGKSSFITSRSRMPGKWIKVAWRKELLTNGKALLPILPSDTWRCWLCMNAKIISVDHKSQALSN